MKLVMAKTIALDAGLLVAELEKEEPNWARVAYVIENIKLHVRDLQFKLVNEGVDVHDNL